MFGAIDFVVFIVMLIIALGIGIYYAIVDRKKEDIENYNYGGRNMSPIPVALSLAVTNISAITIIGLPVQVYKYGLVMFWYCFAPVFPNIFAYLYFIPITLRLQLTTFYQYLELRFQKKNRLLASFSEIFNMVQYMGVAVYVPALALNTVTPLSIPVSIVLTSIVCTAYTALGGLKAVIWTDTLQSMVMLVGIFAVMIKVGFVVGGLENIWAAMDRGGRINIFKMDFDIRTQRSLLNLIAGYSIGSLMAVCNQTVMQRFMSCSSVKNARTASLSSILPLFLFTFTSVLSGCAAYAYFEYCDPEKAGYIEKSDQLMPYLVLTVFRDLPGMAGLFASAAFSATLSTVSSGINSVSLLLMEDFVIPCFKNLGPRMTLAINKLIAVLLGILITLFSLLVDKIGTTVIVITISFFGASGGPLVGVFILGYFIPWANSTGAFVGQIVGTVFTMWIALGAAFYGVPAQFVNELPTSIENCSMNGTINDTTSVFSTLQNVSTVLLNEELTLQNTLYALSFTYYSVTGITVTIIVGLTVSFITGANTPSESNPDYFVPLIDNPILPTKVRKVFRFGVPECQTKPIKEKKDTKSSSKELPNAKDFLLGAVG